jgi:hypothetical protein
MYAFLAILVAVACLLITLALPFRYEGWVRKTLRCLRRVALRPPGEVQFYSQHGVEESELRWARIWGVAAAFFFVVFTMLDGTVIRNHPDSVAAAGFYGALAMGTSGLFVFSCLAYASFLLKTRACAPALKRCGFHKLWFVDPKRPSKGLQEAIAARAAKSTHLGILDVTGHETLGKGSGPNGGLLYDTIAANTALPVTLLLLHPKVEERDPERRKATVLQSVLAELGIPAEIYRRRVRITLEVVKTLNAQRPPEGKIQVSFYLERPAFRAVIFDDAALVSPLSPAQHETLYTLHEARPLAAEPSFFKMFRYQFARLRATASAVAIPQPTASEEARDELVSVNLAAREDS